jgi:membrane protease YdiL (CAAX protease family)
MGQLYEYSKTDDRPRRVASASADMPDTPTTTTADEILGTVTVTNTPQEKNATPTTAQPTHINTADVVVAGLFTLMSLCFTLFINTLLLMPMPSEEVMNSSQPFQVELESVLAAYSTEVIALYTFLAVHSGLGMFLGFGYVVVRLRSNWDVIGLRPLASSKLSYAAGMGAVGALGLWGGNLLAVLASGNLATYRENVIETITTTPSPVVLTAIVMWIIVMPLVQELFFRGVIYTWLRQSQGLAWALVLNGLINGAFNLFLLDFLSSVLLAVGLGYIYERTNSVLGAFLAHSSFNFTAIILFALVIFLGG